jgi:HD-GYP domain-containing protein (c-di-GMP phosphodiesterase class II)
MEQPMNDVWFQFLLRLSRYIDSRISASGRHSTQVAHWSRATLKHLDPLSRDLQVIYWAALLHDVGKIGVPDEVLVKAGPLTEQEWTWIRLHPILGGNIIRATNMIAQIAPIISAHQEKVDGTGYPNGLRGDEIPLGARILAVVDAYDAMTNDRVYRRARTSTEAIRELRRLEGKHFDAQVVSAFLHVINDHRPPLGRKKSRARLVE